MVDVQTVGVLVTAASVSMAAIYYIISLRRTTQAKDIEICRLFTSDFTSDEAMQRYATVMNMESKDYDGFLEMYGNKNPQGFSKWYSLFFVWETLGYLVKKKIVDIETLYAVGAWGCIRMWEKYKDIIKNHRNMVMGQDFMINFEFLTNEMLKIKTRNDASFKDRLETYKLTLKL